MISDKRESIAKSEIETETLSQSIVTTDQIVEIDGSLLEGGGQILRISILLAILFNKKLKMKNIRGKRSNPGLQRQHLAATSCICQITGSNLQGAKINSKEIFISPGNINLINSDNSPIKCDCNGAGSIGLLIQQTLPCIIFSKIKIKLDLVGGTIVSHAPSTFYIEHVLRPILMKMGINFDLEIKKHGLFPVGLGQVLFTSYPVENIHPLNDTSRGKIRKVQFRIACTNNFTKFDVDKAFKEILKEIKKNLNRYIKVIYGPYEIEDILELSTDKIDLYKSKNCTTLFAQIILEFENTIVSCENLFSQKKETNEVLQFNEKLISNLEEILHNDNICLDEYTVDHLIIFMALAKGRSKIHIGKISNHTITAIEIIKIFYPDIQIEICSYEDYSIIEIEGIGFCHI